MLREIFECSEDTIRRRIDTLVKTGDIVYTQICGYIKTTDSLGRFNKETTQRGIDCPSFLSSSPSRNTDRWIKESAYSDISWRCTPENCL